MNGGGKNEQDKIEVLRSLLGQKHGAIREDHQTRLLNKQAFGQDHRAGEPVGVLYIDFIWESVKFWNSDARNEFYVRLGLELAKADEGMVFYHFYDEVFVVRFRDPSTAEVQMLALVTHLRALDMTFARHGTTFPAKGISCHFGIAGDFDGAYLRAARVTK